MADAAWHAKMVELVRGRDVAEATDALLALTYHEPDRVWLQGFLLECLEPEVDRQVRALAVTCVGHVARLDHEVGPALVARLGQLQEDPVLGGIVEDALIDIGTFAAERSGGEEA
ncbi:hypothetical protein [Amycolatopsis sp. cmx-4-68]|uniref:hypothetical protein n=1 Tax=Amycolatopsis sp. cmx-4-68 TaxID=2790938 RepID=UPI003978F0AF